MAALMGFLHASHGAIIHVHSDSFAIEESPGAEGWVQLRENDVPVRFVWEMDRFFIDGFASPENYRFAALLPRGNIRPFQLEESIGPTGDVSWMESGGSLTWPVEADSFYDTEGYVGVRISELDDWFYAWIRVSHDATAGVLTVHDWAWNTVPNEPILAGQVPEPATVALLAGIAALLAVTVLRRRLRPDGA